MEFGSQNFFNRLKAGVTAGDPDVYVDLNDMVDRSVRYLVSAQVNASDVEDVLQEIKITVWRQMSFFLQSSADNTPSQRNAWLIKVTKSRINDFRRKNYVNRPQQLEDGDTSGGGTPPEPHPDLSSLLTAEQQINYERCCRAISHICNLDMAPDRLLACLYNGVLIPAASTGGARKKGDPSAILRRFSGQPLSALRAALWRELRQLLILPPPEGLLAPLDRKLAGGAADTPFQLTARETTLVTSRSRSSVKKSRNEILGGTLDE